MTPPDQRDEAVARIIDPDAFKTKAEWYAELGPKMADQVFARLQSDVTVERMSPRRKIALAKAQAVLSVLKAERGE